MGFTFDIELDTPQPFIVDLELEDYNTQTLNGAIVLHLERPEKFKVATVAIHGHIGIALNVDTPRHSIVHEPLIQSTVDLVAANDTDGHGIIKFDAAGTQYLPFRIDIPRSGELPPTLINKLDTHYIDWKYEIHATLQRDHIFSTTRVFKHDLILRRSLDPREEDTQALITASTDMPKQFKSKLSVPSRIGLGQNQLVATVEMKARHKSYMIREIDCAVVQTEDINYFTRRGHPSVENAHVPGVPCKVNASRLVSAIKKIPNEENDLDFGRHKPIELNVHLDNHQLIPTEHGLDWLDISHTLRFTVHFMDVNLPAIITELPLFVAHEEIQPDPTTGITQEVNEKASVLSTKARLMNSLKIIGAENHVLNSQGEATPEAA
ncbi:hypothetical protein BGZ75_007199 [Mortierella antarctica]|nr:hypothetical protein BGZ75_007199 [Mortierella antarctica]